MQKEPDDSSEKNDWGNVPTEHLLLIFEQLEDGIDLCVASMVNRNWYYSSQLPSLWNWLSVLLHSKLKPPSPLPSFPPSWPRWRGYHMFLLRKSQPTAFQIDTTSLKLDACEPGALLYSWRVLVLILQETLRTIMQNDKICSIGWWRRHTTNPRCECSLFRDPASSRS